MAVEFAGGVVTDVVLCGAGASMANIWDAGGAYDFYIYLDSYDTTLRRMLDKGAFVGGANNGWTACVQTIAANNAILFTIDRATTRATWRWYDYLAVAGWHHIAVNYDADGITNDPALYLDGTLQTLSLGAGGGGGVGARGDDTAEVFSVGNIDNGLARGIDGQMDDPRIYSTTLTTQEIIIRAAGYRGPIGKEVGWWSGSDFQALGHPDGTTLTTSHIMSDLTGNGNDGTPTNSPIARASEAPRVPIWAIWAHAFRSIATSLLEFVFSPTARVLADTTPTVAIMLDATPTLNVEMRQP